MRKLSSLLAKRRFLLMNLLFIILLVFLFINPADNRHNVNRWIEAQLAPNADNFVNAETSFGRYKTIRDSLENIRIWNESRIRATGTSWSLFSIGVRKLSECDSCNKIAGGENSKSLGYQSKYFLNVNGFALKPQSSFYLNKEKYFIRTLVWRDTSDGSVGKAERKQINVRFSSDLALYHEPQTALLVPISKNWYYALDILFKICLLPLIAFLFWFFIFLPCTTIYQMAKGKAFTKDNIKNIRTVAWTLLTMIGFPIIISMITKLVMGHKIPKEIYFPVWLYLNDNKGWIIAAVFLFILANALKAGLKLQEEQELTV